MVIKSLKELKAAKAKVEQLEQEVQKALVSRLSGLPDELGFESIDELITALRSVSKSGGSSSGKRRGRKAKAKAVGKAKVPAKAAGAKRRGRAKITPEVKDKVKALVAEGKTGSAIAKELGISLPSVQNIKKEAGLVKARENA